MAFARVSSYDDADDSMRGIRHDIRELGSMFDSAQAAQRKTDAQMLAAFNSIANALTALATEVKGLREDLSPQLGKPAKLGAPKTGATP
ncbi:MAG: hypothetical protein IT560_03045 [Alphaproteobacteria bacterium]|nr:hypothetical protein [Alphaproteobacteria bacterium]